MGCYMINAYYINRLCAQLHCTLRKIHQTRSHIDENITKLIVQALVLSRIDYCSSHLIGSTEYQLEKLQRAQNMSCRVIYEVMKFNHVRPVNTTSLQNICRNYFFYYCWWFFVSDFQVFAFYHVLLGVIPTPWTHMVLDVLSCYLIRLYWQYLPKDVCSS